MVAQKYCTIKINVSKCEQISVLGLILLFPCKMVMMDLYAENILDHYRHPRGKQALPSPSVTHEEVNLSCGDALTVQLQIEGDRVTSVGWEGSGCAISQAAMSMLSEELAGKLLKEIESMQKESVYDLLGVPIGPRRVKCALLCLHAVKNAVREYKGQPMQGWMETSA